MNVDSTLRLAIMNKRLLELRYKGKSRVVEPHDYGVRKGRERLLVFQLSTSTATGRKQSGWRLLDVAGIEQLQMGASEFAGSRAEPGHSHMTWDVLYARVGA